MSPYDNYVPPPISRRIFVGADELFTDLLRQFGLDTAEYRGTDVETGYELWQFLDPPMSFFIDHAIPKVVIFNIGSDFDQPH